MKKLASKTGRIDYCVGDQLHTLEATYALCEEIAGEVYYVVYREDGGWNDDNWEFDTLLDAETCFVDHASRLRDVVTEWDFI